MVLLLLVAMFGVISNSVVATSEYEYSHIMVGDDDDEVTLNIYVPEDTGKLTFNFNPKISVHGSFNINGPNGESFSGVCPIDTLKTWNNPTNGTWHVSFRMSAFGNAAGVVTISSDKALSVGPQIQKFLRTDLTMHTSSDYHYGFNLTSGVSLLTVRYETRGNGYATATLKKPDGTVVGSGGGWGGTGRVTLGTVKNPEAGVWIVDVSCSNPPAGANIDILTNETNYWEKASVKSKSVSISPRGTAEVIVPVTSDVNELVLTIPIDVEATIVDPDGKRVYYIDQSWTTTRRQLNLMFPIEGDYEVQLSSTKSISDEVIYATSIKKGTLRQYLAQLFLQKMREKGLTDLPYADFLEQHDAEISLTVATIELFSKFEIVTAPPMDIVDQMEDLTDMYVIANNVKQEDYAGAFYKFATKVIPDVMADYIGKTITIHTTLAGAQIGAVVGFAIGGPPGALALMAVGGVAGYQLGQITEGLLEVGAAYIEVKADEYEDDFKSGCATVQEAAQKTYGNLKSKAGDINDGVVSILSHSCVNLHAYDEEGRHDGLTVTEELELEICSESPKVSSVYFNWPSLNLTVIYIGPHIAGKVTFVEEGIEDPAYSLTIAVVSKGEVQLMKEFTNVEISAGAKHTQKVSLNPDIEYSPNKWEAGSVSQGEELWTDLTITNIGNSTLAGDITAPSWINLETYNFALAPGGSITILATINTYVEKGSYLDEIQIRSNDVDEELVSIPVSFVIGEADLFGVLLLQIIVVVAIAAVGVAVVAFIFIRRRRPESC